MLKTLVHIAIHNHEYGIFIYQSQAIEVYLDRVDALSCNENSLINIIRLPSPLPAYIL